MGSSSKRARHVISASSVFAHHPSKAGMWNWALPSAAQRRFGSLVDRSFDPSPKFTASKTTEALHRLPFHSGIDVEWQCGQSITSCSPAKCIWNLSIDASPDKLPGNLTEPDFWSVSFGSHSKRYESMSRLFQ